MKPAPFTLHRPRSVDEAVALLARHHAEGVDSKPIAGGQSLVPMMNLRLARPDHLVDLSAIGELARLEVSGGRLRIGATVTQRRCLADPAVAATAPLLVAGLGLIGHGHIRNRGTVGGSVAHADPAAELPTALVALDAQLELAGPDGRRTVAAADFFEGWLTTVARPGELMATIVVPPMAGPPGGTVDWGFEELARRRGDFAMVLAATVVQRGVDGTVHDSRVVVGGVGPVPQRIPQAEAALAGTAAGTGVEAAAAAARAAVDPTGDVHADAEYRRELVEVLVARCLRRGNRVQPAAATGPAPDGPGPDRTGAPDRTTVEVNGTARPLDGVPDRTLLADWLRDGCGLTGTHLGCEHGVCGACTVLLDGDPVRSCLIFAAQAAGRAVTTIEHLGTPDRLHPVQEAFRTHHGLQCGFCTPGMVLASVDLLRRVPDPTEAQIRSELSGNLCRCTGYVKIVEAVRAAAAAIDPAHQADPARPAPPAG